MSSLKEMIKLFALFLCCSVSLSDWMDEYNNDKRPLCSKEWNKNGRRDEARIFGGMLSGRRRFPFAVLLRITEVLLRITEGYLSFVKTFCGGTLITDRHVLTAAHCVYPMTQQRKKLTNVTVADYDLEESNEVTSYLRKIDTIHHHPDYRDGYSMDSDIAIITLDKPIPQKRRRKIPVLPPLGMELITGTRCTIWGWGKTETAGEWPSILRKVRVPIVGRADCQNLMPKYITPNMICAGGKKGKGLCNGDAGGSLLCQQDGVDCLVGIASFSFNKSCALNGIPDVYVDVAKFTDWIYTNTINGSCKPEIMDPVSHK